VRDGFDFIKESSSFGAANVSSHGTTDGAGHTILIMDGWADDEWHLID